MATQPKGKEVIFNITGMWAFPFTDEDTFTYGDPSFVKYGGNVSWEKTMANAELDSYGQTVEYLSVVKKVQGNFSQGALDFETLAIMTGTTRQDSSGDEYIDIETGGRGLPFFGFMIRWESNKGQGLAGFSKVKLEQYPGFTIEQNSYRMVELAWHGLPIFGSDGKGRAARYRTFESGATPPTDGAEFKAFFGGVFFPV